jgi:hypothetical protein
MNDNEQSKASPALAAMGYKIAKDSPNGAFAMTLESPYEGASIAGKLSGAGREWHGVASIRNVNGIGWSAEFDCRDCPRWLAKTMILHTAIELRRQYIHRSKTIRKRAIARALDRDAAAEAVSCLPPAIPAAADEKVPYMPPVFDNLPPFPFGECKVPSVAGGGAE